MLDLHYICEHQEQIAENCRNRGVEIDVAAVVELRERRSRLISEGDQLRREQKEISSRIPRASPNEKPLLIEQGRQLREQVSAIEAEAKDVEATLRAEQGRIPNLTHPDAPIGRTEADSTVLRTWGERPQFDFTPLDHVEIAERLDLIDFEAGSRVAGHGFYYLRNDAVMLETALIQHALEKLRDKAFTLHTTPDLARDSILEGIGFIPRGSETQIYSVENSDLSLVATAEITLGGAFSDQVLDREKLPIRLAGLSHCFRTEAGAHGRATRGIYRVHQFTKVEMFGFTLPDVAPSDAFLEQIVEIEEDIFQELGIPYRVVDTCTADLGGPAWRKFDLEAWMPGRGNGGMYGEVTSASNCTDYQARRLGIRCRNPNRKGTQFVHTLNGTAISCARAIIAILENYQQVDGTVAVPEVLQKWVGRSVIGLPD